MATGASPIPSTPVNYLRLSITDRCNLRCFYCTYWQEWEKLAPAEILRYEELLRVARIAAQVGIRKIRLTGGEPLVRRGLAEFIRNLKQVQGIDELCLTTNGTLLAQQAPALYEAGLHCLNVSLDTLRPDRYLKITGRDNLLEVMEGLELASALDFRPVKINCVVLKGINDDEVLNLALLAFEHHFHVRFIELMPTGSKREWHRHYLPMAEVRRRLAVLGEFEELTPGATAGPARIFRVPGGLGEVGFISPMSAHHCGTCNRLRLTAQGRLRPCLLGNSEFDIKAALRRDCSDEVLASIFQEAMRFKSFRPEPWAGTTPSLFRSMAAIGG